MSALIRVTRYGRTITEHSVPAEWATAGRDVPAICGTPTNGDTYFAERPGANGGRPCRRCAAILQKSLDVYP